MHELIKESPSLITTRFNAHLTFNVLNSVQGFVAEKDPETAMELINAYSRILRRILINGRTEASLQEELEVVRDFLEIEKICRSRDFSYSLQIDESFNSLIIPKSLLVSIVENGVKHGSRKLNGAGWIRIRAWHEESGGTRPAGIPMISVRNLAPAHTRESQHDSGSVHGKELLQSLVDDYVAKTGRPVTMEMKEYPMDDHFTEVEVAVRLG